MNRAFYRNGLLSAALIWAAPAHGESVGGAPTLLPLPDAAPQVQVAYNATTRSQPSLQPQPITAAPVSPESSQVQVVEAPGYMAGVNHTGIYGGGAPVNAIPAGDSSHHGGGCGAASENPWAGWGHEERRSVGCGDDGNCNWLSSCGCGGAWFGGANYLVLGRNNPNAFWTTFETNNNPNQLLNTRDALGNYKSGGEIQFGRWFCNGCCGNNLGLAVDYWTTAHLGGQATIRDVNNLLSTPIDVGNVNITNGLGTNTAASFFDNARSHRITRSDELHNVELNLLSGSAYTSCNLNVMWLAGVRFFRFDETLRFESVQGGVEFGQNNGQNQVALQSRCVNNLVGFQIGTRVDYCVWRNFGIYAMPKIGIYGNGTNARNVLYTGDGFTQFDIAGSRTDFSTIAQLDLGGTYSFGQCNNWRAFAGYRMMGITNVALSDNQFLPFLADTAGFADVKSNGSLILHGGYTGLEYRF